jgi:hypothetical protein
LACRGICDAVGDAGVVEVTSATLQRLGSVPSEPDNAQAVGLGPQHAAQGLEVLHCVCTSHNANLQRLAAAGGLPAVAAGKHTGGLQQCPRKQLDDGRQGLQVLCWLKCSFAYI